VAAVWVLAMSEEARSFHAGHPAEPLRLLLLYLPSILQVEVCFRGVLLFALHPRLGPVGAAAVAALPYGLVHLDKPLPEALGSVPVGFALGWLAAWTGSIWYGLVLHLVGAISLALLASSMA
jgi:membrane protease YdiL (CAAX protease family)